MGFNKKFLSTGGIVASSPAAAAFDPLQNFETVTYTGNGGTQKITGYIRKGAAFNGSSSYINLGSASSLVSTNFTFSAWIKTTATSTDWIIGTDVNPYYSKVAVRSEGDGTLTCLYGNYTSNENSFSSSYNTINNGEWHHIVYFINQTTAKLYIDGSLDTTHTLTVTPTTNGNLTLGSIYIASSSTYSSSTWADNIDQVRIFNKELSSSEVTTLYGETYASSTKSTADIFGDGSGVALYELDEDANDTGGTYNGTPTNVNFLGMAFQPDLVWIKDRSIAREHILCDSVRGVNKELSSNATDAEESRGVNSFDSNGFTLDGLTPNYNGNNESYVAWCWKAGGSAVSNTDGSVTSSVSANQDAGFSVVKWTGTGGINTIGHGLSEPPELILIKPIDANSNWQVYAEPIGNAKKLVLDSSDAQGNTTRFDSTSPTSSVFTFRDVGISGDFISYCFHSVDGYQKVGSYSGSGGAGNKQTTGFQPRFVMLKAYSGTSGWFIFDSVRSGEKRLSANTSSAESDETNHGINFESDGFSFDAADANNSGVDWIYLAIA